ncbi:MAG: hypothetical protein ACRD16_00710 [Thermoanaerobaculia bacterium]
MAAEVPRPLFLAFFLAGALGAVLLSDPKVSSFLAGFAVGTGAVFVLSFLKNPRRPGSGSADEGESLGRER